MNKYKINNNIDSKELLNEKYADNKTIDYFFINKLMDLKNNFQLLKKREQEIKLKLINYKILIIIIY